MISGKSEETDRRLLMAAAWRDAPYFTDAERAALALTEAVLQPSTAGEEKVTDELYARAAEHWTLRYPSWRQGFPASYGQNPSPATTTA